MKIYSKQSLPSHIFFKSYKGGFRIYKPDGPFEVEIAPGKIEYSKDGYLLLDVNNNPSILKKKDYKED